MLKRIINSGLMFLFAALALASSVGSIVCFMLCVGDPVEPMGFWVETAYTFGGFLGSILLAILTVFLLYIASLFAKRSEK